MSAVDAQLVLPDPLFDRHSGWPYITVLSGGGYAHMTQAENLDALNGTFRWHTSWGYSELALWDDEGVTWIRGWHERAAPAVDSAMAAQQLVGSTQ